MWALDLARCISFAQHQLPYVARKSFSRYSNILIFTGQGAQWHGMARQLLDYPVFLNSIDFSEKLFCSLGSEWSLKDELRRDKPTSNLDKPEISQPICTALQVALVELLGSWNVHPTAVVGHSSGEIAAAYCAGALSREAALTIAYYRGIHCALLLSSSLQCGAMLAVGLSEAAIAPYFARVPIEFGQIAVACINSPHSVTLSGSEHGIDFVHGILEQDKIFCRKPRVNLAYHSSSMVHVVPGYLASLQNVPFQQPPLVSKTSRASMFSTVSGEVVQTEYLGRAEYWTHSLTSKVKFSDAVEKMLLGEFESSTELHDWAEVIMIEIGPSAALSRYTKEILAELDLNKASYDTALMKGRSASQTTMELAGRLHYRGYGVDLVAVNASTSEAKSKMLVNLPEYQFNHSKQYWHESRLSKGFRFRRHARHNLLRTPSSDVNALEPQWRNIIRIHENKWVLEHKFNGSHIYPAAGMIVMAVEAVRQVSDPLLVLTGYRLKDVKFVKALVISQSSESVETQIVLRSRSDSIGPKLRGYEFQIFMCSRDEWSEICRGSVRAEYDHVDGEKHDIERFKSSFDAISNSCTVAVDSKQLYHNLETYGFCFGPSFQTLEAVRYSKTGKATASISLQKSACQETQDHVIHPTALDGLFHLTAVAVSQGGSVAIPTMVPTQLRELWISNSLVTGIAEDRLEVCSSLTFKGYREGEFDLLAANPYDNEPRIIVKAYRGTAITGLDIPAPSDNLDMMDKEQISRYCEAKGDGSGTQITDQIDELELACLYFMKETIHSLSEYKVNEANSYLQRYLAWMQYQLERVDTRLISEGNPLFLAGVEHTNEYLRVLENSGPEGRLYITVGSNLMSILQGDVDPLDLLFHGSFAHDFYHSDAFAANYMKLAAYIDLLAYANPNLSVIEVGAGTGAATRQIMKVLSSETGTPRYREYTFTDISLGFFEEARQTFHTQTDWMTFKVLDIEKDPLEQNFKEAAYDLVIAAGVLHATANLDVTLRNTRKLLTPHGKLIMFEPCNLTCLRVPFVFGLLPGWWRATEENRNMGPLLSEDDWHKTLLRNGFTGIDFCLRDSQEPIKHTFSAIFSTASNDYTAPAGIAKITILVSEHSSLQNDLAQGFDSHISALPGTTCEISHLQDIQSNINHSRFFISLLELEQSVFFDLNDQDFVNFKYMVQRSNKVLWITHGGGEHALRPESDIILGLSRSLRSEKSNLNFVTLALEDISSISTAVNNVMKVVKKTLLPLAESNESEYMERNGLMCLSRITEANDLKFNINSKAMTRKPEMKKFGGNSGQGLEVAIESIGLLDSLCFVEDSEFERPLDANEVEIEVKAAGINFKDVMVALGQVPDTHIGFECAGLVARVGLDAELKVGDRVCCIASGALKTYARADIALVHKILDDMPYQHAAALPVVYCTAYYALFDLAHLKSQESVLIHSGAGGVGQAAIQLARSVYANIFVTVANDEKKALLMDLYDIPEDHFFSSRNTSFCQGIHRMTEGKGVDVVLNSLSGEGLSRSWECVAPFGRFIEIGKMDIMSNEKLPMLPFSKNLTFASVDLSIMAVHAIPLMAELLRKVLALASAQPAVITAPTPLHVYPISEIEAAFRYLQSGKNTGKTVVEVHEHDVVPVLPRNRPTWRFDCDSSYMISGGLGGLGRSMTRWMASRGAKNIILPSRSGPVSGVLGNRSQSNYAAGNTYQDAIARHRVSLGQKCVSLDLGMILSVGFAAERVHVTESLKAAGYQGIRESEFLGMLDELCNPSRDLPLLLKFQVITGLTTPQSLKSKGMDEMFWMERPIFRLLHNFERSKISTTANELNDKFDYKTLFRQGGKSIEELGYLVTQSLIMKLAKAVSIPEADIDASKPIYDFGVDSLVAVEIRYWILKEFQTEVAIFNILGSKSIEELGLLVARKSPFLKESITDHQED
ncbi:uncharacterized protein LY89DRAFT_722023 [Mollisia scopiformis]|uniref:Uncharacterized protein n=1 Tax=Mollisia scopiformis TaxID=149040 RepID=A0A194WWS0_MOLSC|nr:uncharacterized protein LY89DRAFT_722023 [Mollisia scopiformis]KUJ12390.1 hypothetical protein LY89DRAFT_722023 [Mollisia scopiformis]